MTSSNVRIGKYRHRVDIERATETQDSTGGVVKTWTVLHHRWASVNTASPSQEIERAGKTQGFIAYDIEMWAEDDLNVRDRIVYKGRPLEIESIHSESGLRDVIKIRAFEQTT